MGKPQRIELYKKIEEYRKRPLIVYVTSKREGISASMATDALPSIIEQLDCVPDKSKGLDLLIASYGGDPMVAWRIITLVRQRFKEVSILIPQSAYSAATLLALGGNEIVMHPNGHLGPVDMQIRSFDEMGRAKQFSTEDISAFLDFVRENLKITDQEHIRTLFEVICKEVSSLGIGFTVRCSKLAVDLGERLLALHMKDDENRSKLRTLVENMSRKFQSHSYPVNRNEAKELGLPVSKEDKNLEKMMWDLWLDIESELSERIPFSAIHELMNSGQASKLLSPVPQLELPMNAGTSENLSANIADVQAAATVRVDPVPFECKKAMVESSRMAHVCLSGGKILACRTPDLMIQYNVVRSYSGWKQDT